MIFLDTFQQKVGFTRREAIAILTLSSTFLAGLGIRWFQSKESDAVQTIHQFDYSKSDSIYAERSRKSEQESPPPTTPRKSLSATAPSKKTKPMRIVAINTATKSELMSLPGIGPSFADRIIAYRKANGRFTSTDQLTRVKGIGEKTMEKLRPFVVTK